MLSVADLTRYAALEAAIPKVRVWIADREASIARLRRFGEPVPALLTSQLAEYRTRLIGYLAEKAAIAARDTPALPAIVAPPTVQTGIRPPPLDLLTATSADLWAWCNVTAGAVGSPGHSACYQGLLTSQRQVKAIQASLVFPTVTLNETLTEAANATAGGSTDLFTQIADFLAGIGSAVTTPIAGALGSVTEGVGGLVDTIAGGIGALLSGAASTVGGAVGSVVESLARLVSGAAGTLGTIASTVTGALGKAVSTAAGTLGRLGTTVLDAIGSSLGVAGDFIVTVGTTAVDAVGGLIGGAGDLLGDIVTTVRDRIAAILSDLSGAVGAIVEGVSGLPAALLGLGGEMIGGLAAIIGDGVEGLATFLADPVKGIIGGFLHGEEPEIVATVDAIYARLERNPELPADLRGILASSRRTDHPLWAMVGLIILPFAITTILGLALRPVASLIEQEENVALRPSLLTLGDAVQAVQRQLRDDGYLARVGGRQGYTDPDIELALSLAERQPSPADLAEMLHREIITESGFADRLGKLGYADPDVAAYAQLAAVLPPLTDAVRFAVREAFPGQSGFDGARGAGTPAGFAKLVKQLGLESDWARSYWAAHWELPSVTAGFEMLHRGIISEGKLRQLITEADYAPDWHAELIALSYSPLTRVDVRRMYDTGVLTAGEVEGAYLDLGYSPDNARRLRAFVVKLSAESGRDEAAVERDLTRADLTGAYGDGIIDRPALLASLTNLGYDPIEAELLADRADFAVAKARRSAVKAGVVAQGKAGTLDAIGVQSQLSAAGFAQGEVDLVLDEIERARAVKVTLPAKADWKGWYGAEIVTEAEARTGLGDLGYAPVNVDRFLAGWKAGLTDAAEA